jgi:hypothetical protein
MHGILKALCNSRTGVCLGKLPMVWRTLFCRLCKFNRWVSAANFHVGEAQAVMDLMCALWRVSLMLALNGLLLNREYVLINALKALVSIVFMSSLHVIFLSNITPRYFILFSKG